MSNQTNGLGNNGVRTAGIGKAFAAANPFVRVDRLRELDGALTHSEMKDLLERCGFLDKEKAQLGNIIERVGAFQTPEKPEQDADDIPF